MKEKENRIRVIQSPRVFNVENLELDDARLRIHLDLYRIIMSEAPNDAGLVAKKGFSLKKK